MSKIEDSVCKKIQDRAKLGLSKYGVDLQNSGLSIMEVLNHAQQEAMDLSNYLETIMSIQTHNYLVIYDDNTVETFEKLPELYCEVGSDRLFHIVKIIDLFHAVSGKLVCYNFEKSRWDTF